MSAPLFRCQRAPTRARGLCECGKRLREPDRQLARRCRAAMRGEAVGWDGETPVGMTNRGVVRRWRFAPR
eukprot:6183587-Pyramimonas_sp.AAC.1